MPFKLPPQQPDFSPLKISLASSGFQTKNNALYQTILYGIEKTIQFQKLTVSDLDDRIIGPTSSTDNAIARFDGTNGKRIKNSSILINDTGILQFGGTTTDFLALKPNELTLEVKLADDSDYASLKADGLILVHGLIVDVSTIFVDPVNHRVGIGTTIPSQTLEVNGFTTIDGQLTTVAALGNLFILNNSAADAGVTGSCYFTFQTATANRWYLGMSAAGSTGNFDLYDNIDGYNVASWTKGSGLFQCLKGITVTGLTTLATVASPLIVHTNGIAQRIDIGATGDTSSSSQIRLFQDSTHYNWQIGAGIQNNDSLSITPSTAINGTTFSSPIFSFNLTGTTSLVPHSVSFAGASLFSINNSNTDAGVTNGSYMTFNTAGTTRYYVGISTSGANGNWEIYNNGAGNLAFSIDKTTSAIKLFGKLTSYNNIVTTGWGTPAIYGTGRVTAQTAAVASIAAYTVGAADGSFIISANINVTTSTLHSFTVECAYTDETNTARVLTLSFSQLTGAFVTTITNGTGAGPYEGVPLHIRCKASTTITIRTQAAGVYTTVTYNAEGSITQIA